MRPIRKLVVHCAATPPSADIGRKEIDRWHRQRGFLCIGYHYVIRRDGRVEEGRPEEQAGAHVEGHNRDSIGICMVGGLAEDGKTPEDNFTPAQYVSLEAVLRGLRGRYAQADILGHRDLSPDRNGDGRVTKNEWLKACPSFDVRTWAASRNLK
jgi:N-acetyl-anhydromuramyl-L-alanine amidase AmpD